jgi:flagellar FliL protein
VPLASGTSLAPSVGIMSDAPIPEAKQPKKKKSALPMIIAGAVVVVAALGGGGYWYMHRAAAAAHPEEEHVSVAERGIVLFAPFVVNLADPNSSRFLRITLQLVVGDEKQAAHILETPVILAQARSAILELLTLQTSDQLVTTVGKTALKESIAARVNTAIEDVEVLDVLFSDFVVQL